MKSNKLKRTFIEGLDNFYRNGWLTFATVSVLAISLYIISATVLLVVTSGIILKNIQNDINISVYFNPDVKEEKILDIKESLVGFKEINSISYVTKEQALDQLKKFGEGNPSIPKALDVIGENPLSPSLVIKANDPSDYEKISNSLSTSSYAEFISRISFEEHKKAIEKLTSIIDMVERVGITLGIVFVIIGILITFNAIRLTMYSHRKEFEIMRLVGASNTYIRMPFIFEGIFYGAVSAFMVLILLFITSKFLAPLTASSAEGGNIVSFYLHNFFTIFGLLLISGIALGTLSAFIAIRRYLKI
jgi:cell division transport system permease protein